MIACPEYVLTFKIQKTSVDIEKAEINENVSSGMTSENNTEKKDDADMNEKRLENADGEKEKFSKKMMPFKASHVVSSVKVRLFFSTSNFLIKLYFIKINQRY